VCYGASDRYNSNRHFTREVGNLRHQKIEMAIIFADGAIATQFTKNLKYRTYATVTICGWCVTLKVLLLRSNILAASRTLQKKYAGLKGLAPPSLVGKGAGGLGIRILPIES
jgi:hypothetical protein